MIVVQTPLRTSFLGGGTDFDDFYRREGGCVLSSAINKYVYVVLKQRFDDNIYINYSKKEIVDNIGAIQHGLVREAMKLTRVEKGIEVTTLSDIPSEGTGLGSSSSITVSLLHALHTYNGTLVTADTLAREACHIEIDILGKPIGRQDQYIAAMGDLRFLTFEKDGEIGVERVKLPPEERSRLEDHLMLFYTNVTRPSENILEEQKASVSDNLESLRTLKSIANEAKRALEEGKLGYFGKLLDEGWSQKRRLAKDISNPTIDRLYKQALGAGATGGKITGAGGGGFLLLCCPPRDQDRVRKALHELRELRFGLEAYGSRVVLNTGK